MTSCALTSSQAKAISQYVGQAQACAYETYITALKSASPAVWTKVLNFVNLFLSKAQNADQTALWGTVYAVVYEFGSGPTQNVSTFNGRGVQPWCDAQLLGAVIYYMYGSTSSQYATWSGNCVSIPADASQWTGLTCGATWCYYFFDPSSNYFMDIDALISTAGSVPFGPDAQFNYIATQLNVTPPYAPLGPTQAFSLLSADPNGMPVPWGFVPTQAGWPLIGQNYTWDYFSNVPPPSPPPIPWGNLTPSSTPPPPTPPIPPVTPTDWVLIASLVLGATALGVALYFVSKRM
jgi:hypothetical protein